jgi:hypothetical protein
VAAASARALPRRRRRDQIFAVLAGIREDSAGIAEAAATRPAGDVCTDPQPWCRAVTAAQGTRIILIVLDAGAVRPTVVILRQ